MERRLTPTEIIARVVALAGLAASSMSLREYTANAPIFCGAGSGCDIVKHSKFAHLLGIPTPVFGVLFFLPALALLLVPEEWARRGVRSLASVGALAAVGLLGIQAFAIHAFCKLCLVSDLSALALLPLALLAKTPTKASTRWVPFAMLGIVAFGLPVFVGKAQPVPKSLIGGKYQAELPPPVAKAQVPGVATVVEFVDFECPYCRKEHAALKPLLAAHAQDVKVIRKMSPLPPDMHPHAADAAAAWCCADEAGHGDEMADALMSADPEKLTPSGCAQIAAKLGVDPGAYQQCLASGRPAQRISTDQQDAKASDVPGLPTFWVGHTRFIGAQKDDKTVEVALEKAISEACR